MQKTVDRQEEKQSKNDTINQSESISESDSIDSWDTLKDRYVNLWRSRRKQDGYMKGVRNAILTGVLLTVPFTALISGYMLFTASILLSSGSMIGCAISGYNNNLDFFGGFHIGLLASSFLTLYMLVGTTLMNPMSGLVLLPFLIPFLAVMGLSTGVYAIVGQELSDEVDEMR